MRDFKIVVETIKYADVLVVSMKEEGTPSDKLDRLVKTGSRYGIEIIVDKSKAIGISRTRKPLRIVRDQEPENVQIVTKFSDKIWPLRQRN